MRFESNGVISVVSSWSSSLAESISCFCLAGRSVRPSLAQLGLFTMRNHHSIQLWALAVPMGYVRTYARTYVCACMYVRKSRRRSSLGSARPPKSVLRCLLTMMNDVRSSLSLYVVHVGVHSNGWFGLSALSSFERRTTLKPNRANADDDDARRFTSDDGRRKKCLRSKKKPEPRFISFAPERCSKARFVRVVCRSR